MLRTYFERTAYPEIYRNPNHTLQRLAFKAFGSILGGSSSRSGKIPDALKGSLSGEDPKKIAGTSFQMPLL